MNKEKIIQICYQKDDINPTILTSSGRIIRAIPNGKYKTVNYIIDKDDSGKNITQNITSELLSYKDITPILDKITK